MKPSIWIGTMGLHSRFVICSLIIVMSLGTAKAYGQPAMLQNFDGLDSVSSAYYPPDPNLAAGPNHVVEMVNLAGRVWNKSGGIIQTYDLRPFFGFAAGTYLTDPMVRYDAVSGRWFASIAGNTTLNLAVSQSSDPTGSWWVYHFSRPGLPDYPRLGMSDDKVVISFMDTTSGSHTAYILNKSELISGSATDYVIYTPSGDTGTPQPVVSLTGTTTEYMIDNSFTNSLTLYSITGVPGVSPVNVTTTGLPFNLTMPPPGAQQLGSTELISTIDDILLSAVWRNGSLWTSATEGCMPPGATIVRSCLLLIEAPTTGVVLPPLSIQFAAIGDLNMDGKPDLAVGNSGTNSVSILLGDGTGSFGTPSDYPAGNGPGPLVIADFNGDGKPDLAVTDVAGNAVSVLLGDGTGSFASPVTYAVGNNPLSVATGDFNGDGHPDLVVANESGNSISVFLGTGSGSFGAAATYPVGSSPQSVAIGDLNGDGHPDLAVANFADDNVSVLMGNGDGTFQPHVEFPAGDGAESVAVGDFNSDGKPDLAVTDFYINKISFLLNNGDGTFAAPRNYGTGSGPSFVALGDFDQDGWLDVAVTNVYAQTVSILMGNGDGTFLLHTDFAAGGGPQSAAIGDLNGDGHPDLAVANPGPNTVSLLFGDGAGAFGAPSPIGFGSGPHVVQDITYGENGYYYFFPSVITDASGNLEVIFGRSSSSEYAGLRVTGRLATDPLYAIQASSLLQPGLASNTSDRWGDYFGAALDPSDTSKVWVAGEYGKYGGYAWGTRIAQLSFNGLLSLNITKSGAGNGTVTSSPPGIDCGADCLEDYSPGTVVTLTATPFTGSVFTGWSGDADCSDGVVTMNTSKTCNAVFSPANGPDLIMSQVTTPATAVAPGKTFTLTNVVHNQGNASAGSFVIAFHLSSDTVFGGADDVVMTTTRSVGSLGIGASSAATTTLTVPSSTPLGAYYVCANADNNGSVAESIESNNALCTAEPIQVTLPDLILTDVTPQTATVNQGAYLPVDNTVMNQGLVPTSSSFRIAFRLSVNTVYGDGDDIAITATRTVATNFQPGTTSFSTTNLLIPSTTPPGVYYVCAMADSLAAVDETDEDNNTLCSATQVTVPPPDLVIPLITTTYDAVAPGKNFTVSTTVMNQGGSKAGAFKIAFHLSTDAAYGGADDIPFTATRSLSSLIIGGSNTGSTTLSVPSDTPLGTYYVCAFADSENTVDEWDNENNNTNCTAMTVEVTLPDLVISNVSPNAATVTHGSSLSVANSVENQSQVASTVFRIGFRLSASDPPSYDDPNGVAITTIRSITSLAAGATSSANTSVTIPGSTAPGVYYVCAKADTLFQVAETDEDNNTSCSGNTVTVQ